MTQRGGLGEWISQSYDPASQTQEVALDMSGHEESAHWELSMGLGEQREVVRVVYTPSEASGGHSFFSFSFDWPDILLGLMAVTFASIFALQYFNEGKVKYA